MKLHIFQLGSVVIIIIIFLAILSVTWNSTLLTNCAISYSISFASKCMLIYSVRLKMLPETQSAIFLSKKNLKLFLPDLFSTHVSLGNILPLNASFLSISSVYACSVAEYDHQSFNVTAASVFVWSYFVFCGSDC